MAKYKVTFTMGIPFEFIAEEAYNEASAKEMALQAFEDLSPEELLSLSCDAQIAHGIHIEELPERQAKILQGREEEAEVNRIVARLIETANLPGITDVIADASGEIIDVRLEREV